MNGESTASTSELSASECWALIRSVPVGRLAVMVDDRVDIFPLNHVADRSSIVVRTTAGTKLAAAVGHHVAFEVDGYDPTSGEFWSVVVKGFATSIEQLHEVLDALQLPLSPWQRSAKPYFLRIEPGTVTGHRSKLGPRDRPGASPFEGGA